MKQFRRIMALLVALLIAVSAVSVAALAEGYAVKKVTQGKWYKLTTGAKTKQLYKLTLKKDSYLICEGKGLKGDDSILEFEIYTKPDANWDNYCGGFGMCGPNGHTLKVAMVKGTYYIKAYDEKGTASLKMNVKALPKAKNTSKAKAIALPRDEYVEVAMLPNGPKTLWYKIKTNRKQVISVKAQDWWETDITPIEIYNSKLQKLTVKYDKDNYSCQTKSKQKAGVYYICVRTPKFNHAQEGGYLGFRWE